MAKNRYINTRIWADHFFSKLDPSEKLLFIYLLTNPFTTICGAYEIPLSQIALDTGIDRDMLQKLMMPRLEEAGKVIYKDGWIWIPNFRKHQSMNPSIQKGIENELSNCPDWIKDKNPPACDRQSHLILSYSTLSNSKGQPVSDDETSFINSALDELKKRLGITFTLPHEPLWVESASWAMRNGFTVTDFLDCYEFLRGQEWRDTAPKPIHIQENLPTFRTAGKKAVKADGFRH